MSVRNLSGSPLHVLLVRHGQSESNVVIDKSRQENDVDHECIDSDIREIEERHKGDVPLTRKGEQQALETGVYLHNLIVANQEKWGKNVLLMESPMQRARDTAECIGDRLHGESFLLPVDSRLVRVGLAYAMSDSPLDRNFAADGMQTSVERNLLEYDGQKETITGLRIRVNRILTQLECLQPGQCNVAVVVGHSLFFSQMIATVSGKYGSPADTVEDLAFHLPNCSVSHLVYSRDTGRWSVLRVADTHHLSEPTGMHYVPVAH